MVDLLMVAAQFVGKIFGPEDARSEDLVAELHGLLVEARQAGADEQERLSRGVARVNKAAGRKVAKARKPRRKRTR